MGLLARRTGRGRSQAPASFLCGELANQPSDGDALAAAFCEPGHFLDENNRRAQWRVEEAIEQHLVDGAFFSHDSTLPQA